MYLLSHSPTLRWVGCRTRPRKCLCWTMGSRASTPPPRARSDPLVPPLGSVAPSDTPQWMLTKTRWVISERQMFCLIDNISLLTHYSSGYIEHSPCERKVGSILICIIIKMVPDASLLTIQHIRIHVCLASPLSNLVSKMRPVPSVMSGREWFIKVVITWFTIDLEKISINI